jgi:hypothetical protein
MQKKVFENIQYPFMVKILDSIDIKGIYLNPVKSVF